MADDIKIKVGVQSSVSSGMKDVERDISRGMKQAVDRSMRGKGFMEAFGKAIRGDISGAVEDLQERLGVGMKSIAGKALLWGGGIATALTAGWKAGKALDDMLGISDAVAAAWVKTSRGVAQTWDNTFSRLRKMRQEWEADVKSTIETDAKLFDMREKRKLGGMSGREKVNYLEEGLPAAQSAVDRAKEIGSKVSLEERKQRELDLEQLVGDIADARQQAEKEYAAKVKADYDARIAKEKELADAKKRGVEQARELERMLLDDELKGIDKAREAREHAIDAAAQARERRRPGLEAAAGQAGAADEIIDMAMNPNAMRAASAQAREEDRRKRKIDNKLREALGRRERGVKGPASDDMLIEGIKARDDANRAAQQLAKDDADARKAAKETAENTRLMQQQVADLNKQIKQIVRP